MASDPREISVEAATFAPFKQAFRWGMSLVILWMVSIVALAVYVHWKKIDGVAHIGEQISYYTDESAPNHMGTVFANATLKAIFDDYKLHTVFRAKARDQSDTGATAPMLKRSVSAAFLPEFQIALHGTVLYAAKLGVAAPLLGVLFLWLVAFGVDGLVQRSIRRSCGGYESAAIYHRAKLYGVRMLPPFAAVIFFCCPVKLPVLAVFVPMALVSAILLRVQATYYKKYL